MTRLALALWLVMFSVQVTELAAVVAPDTCTEESQGTAADPCQDACTRCFCCARIAVYIPHVEAQARSEGLRNAVGTDRLDPSTTSSPYGIFHVPKTR